MSESSHNQTAPHQSGEALNRAQLADRAELEPFWVDLAVDAGLLVPTGDATGELFEPEAVDMLIAARTLMSEGVKVEELAALAMRHAANTEAVIDDALDLFKRQAAQRGHDRSELAESMQRLVPVATRLVASHFERTLVSRAMSRLAEEEDTATAAGTIVVVSRRLQQQVDPLAVFAAADPAEPVAVWLSPSQREGLVALGEVEVVEPSGVDRFAGASAARVTLEARVRRHGPTDAPAPLLVGGFSFTGSGAATATDSEVSPGGSDRRGPGVEHWAGFGDCRLVLAATTIIQQGDEFWIQAAARIGADNDEQQTLRHLEQRLKNFEPPQAVVEQADATADVVGTERVAPRALAELGVDNRYLGLVADGTEAIGAGELAKVVLARSVCLEADMASNWARARVLAGLRSTNPQCAVFAFSAGGPGPCEASDGDPAQSGGVRPLFFGATPEELVTLDGPRIHATALAGTAPRGATPEEDRRLAEQLVASSKEQSEHRFVVENITESLNHLGLVDPTPAEPDVMRLARVQHLSTPITARVARRRSGMSDMDVLRVAGELHPTAAVGGTPTNAAVEWIARREGFHRGWYAAPVGWCALDGNGELCVALRSGLATADRVWLFAGAGIVADSVPQTELDETTFKFQALVEALVAAGVLQPEAAPLPGVDGS